MAISGCGEFCASRGGQCSSFELFPIDGKLHVDDSLCHSARESRYATKSTVIFIILRSQSANRMISGRVGKRGLRWGMRAGPSSPTLKVGVSMGRNCQTRLPGSPLRRIARAELKNEISYNLQKQRVARVSAGWRGHPGGLWVPNQQPCGAEITRRRSGPPPARGGSGRMGGRLQP